MIPFNVPPVVGSEINNIDLALKTKKLSGDGAFNKKCQVWMERQFESPLVLLTPSCTASLEMAAILINIGPGDEVIMPSYTFVSTANAFVLRGATIVFIDVRPDTMNIDEKKIEAAITSKTKAIVPVHYAGVACEMDDIMTIAMKYDLWVIEDAAQGVMSSYKGKMLGTIGHIGCFSFHETKNYTAGGEGGAILVQDERLLERAEIVREKGTDRSKFIKGIVDKYTWIDIGSSFLMSEIQAAYLFSQLEHAVKINENRLNQWKLYRTMILPLVDRGCLEISTINNYCVHNAHMFYIKLQDQTVRTKMADFLNKNGVLSAPHYIPLHSSSYGIKAGRFSGEDINTSRESLRILRLPLWYGLSLSNVKKIVELVKEFFENEK